MTPRWTPNALAERRGRITVKEADGKSLFASMSG